MPRKQQTIERDLGYMFECDCGIKKIFANEKSRKLFEKLHIKKSHNGNINLIDDADVLRKLNGKVVSIGKSVLNNIM